MTTPPGKRPAGEFVGGLFARTAFDPDMRRPAATVAGGVLVLLRVLAGIGVLLTVGGLTDLLPIGQGALIDLLVADDDEPLAVGVILVVGSLLLAAEAVLALFIFRGHNWARVTVMLFAVASISFRFASWRMLGRRIELEGTFTESHRCA